MSSAVGSSAVSSSAVGDAVRQADVREYAAAVRAELSDVPADRSAELLDDLEEHLEEVAADGEESLTSRLGTPAAYARELRAAAGMPAGPLSTDEQRPGAAELVARLRAWGPARHVEDFLPELRPAWWVVRAWAAVTAVDLLFVGGTGFPVPTLGLGPIGFLVTAAAIAWSVRLGLRARAQDRLAGRSVVAVNAGLGLLTLVALIGLADRSDVASADPVYYDDQPLPQTLVHEDGTPITNILPYSSTGEPLTGVLLYDQDGRPIDDLADGTLDGGWVQDVPGGAPQPGNAYPQQREVVTWGPDGQETTAPMPVPTATSTAAATSTPVAAPAEAPAAGAVPAPPAPATP